MNTTAGGFALLGSVVPSDAPVSAKLRQAGVIVIGKANLSQYANFKGNITNGWSARFGQSQSAYVVGGFEAGGDPCGSSSGSGIGVSAGFAAASLGSETDGSIICPSNRAALYGIKMSVGLSSRSGIIPISSTQDTSGPMAKSAYDAALILENMVGYDVNDTATYAAVNHTQTNYTQYTMAPYATFQGMKIGVPREGFFNETLSGNAPEIKYVSSISEGGRDADHTKSSIAVDAAIAKIRSLGASIQDPANLPSFQDYLESNSETIVLQNDFKVDFGAYMSKLISSQVRTLEDVINFNDANADIEFAPGECCQQTMVASFGTPGTNSSEYLAARAENLAIGATNGIDAVLDQYGLDALVLPSEGFATGPPAIVGYPIVTVPLGTLNSTGAPFGLSFIGRKWSEPTLIALM
jgi:amidase